MAAALSASLTGVTATQNKTRRGLKLTEWQLEARVQQEAMGGWVLGAVYLIRLHQDLGVQKDPVA